MNMRVKVALAPIAVVCLSGFGLSQLCAPVKGATPKQAVAIKSQIVKSGPSVVSLIHASRQSIAKGDLDTALQRATEAIAADPVYADAWKQHGRVLMLRGDLRGALESLEKALQLNKDIVEVPQWITQVLFDSQQYSAMLRYLESLSPEVAAAHDSAFIASVLARLTQTNQSGLAKPVASLWQQVAVSDEGRRVAQAIGQIFAAQTADAARTLQAVPRSAADRQLVSLAWTLLGSQQLSSGQADSAVASLQAALEFQPDNRIAQRELGWAYRSSSRPAEAAEAWIRIVRQTFKPAALWAEIAQAYIEANRPDKAAAAVQEVLTLVPLDERGRALKLMLLLEQDPRGAADYEKRLAQQAGGDYVTALGRGMAARKAGRFDQATAHFEKALALRPKNARIQALLLEVCLSWAAQVKPAEAVKPLEKLLRLDPKRTSAWRDLGWGRWALGQHDEAMEAWEKALQAGVKDSGQLATQIAASLIESGEAERGLGVFSRWNPDGSMAAAGQSLFDTDRHRTAEVFLTEAWNRGERTASTGLRLASLVSRRSECLAVMDYLKPALDSGLGKLSSQQLEMVFDTAGRCERASQATELLDALDQRIGEVRDPAYRKRLASLFESAANKKAGLRDSEAAFQLYSKALSLDPDRTIWFRALDLGERLGKVHETARLLQDLERQATSPAVLEGIRAREQARQGQLEIAVGHYQQSLQAEPAQPEIRLELFRHLMTLERFEDARIQEKWFSDRWQEGDRSVRSHLAEVLSALGETERAMEIWRELYLVSPDVPYYTLEYARSAVNLCRCDEAFTALEQLAARSRDARVFELMGEIEAARDRPEQVMTWTERGLEIKQTPTLLRLRAEAAEQLRNYQAAEQAAQALVALDAGNAAAAGILLRTYLAQNRFDRVEIAGQELLQRNPIFLPALNQLKETAAKTGNGRRRLEIARLVASQRSWDADAWRRYALVAAEEGEFGEALSTSAPLAGMKTEQAIPVLLYSRVSACADNGQNTVEQVISHWTRLHGAGYRFISPAEIDPRQGGLRVMVVLINPDPAALDPLDTLLRQIGGKAVLAIDPRSLRAPVPGMPSTEQLQKLQTGGFWILASSASQGRQRGTIDATGTTGNLLTHFLWKGGQVESSRSFEERISRTMAAASDLLPKNQPRLLVYPGGDYGQFSLDTNQEAVALLRSAVETEFDQAIAFDETGFVTVGFDPLRLPGKLVPRRWSDTDLMTHLEQANPLALARLDYAKTLSWTSQHERATAWFKRAGESGADPAEVSFHWGASAYQEGDVPTALSKLRAARNLEPDSIRNGAALRRAEDRKDAALAINASIWEDSDDHRAIRYGAELGTYIGDHVRLSAFADRNRYERDGYGGERGSRFGGGFLWHFAPEWRLNGQAWSLNTDHPENQIGWALDLHMPAVPLGGSLEFHAGRDDISTVEAVRRRIWASEYSLESYSRIANFWELSIEPSFTDRSDGNRTYMVQGHFARRLHEWPFFALGYSFRFADSDRDPIEYWAPLQLRQHQLYMAARGEYGRLRYGLSVQAGYAAQRETNWRFRWGGRPMLGLRLTSHTELRAEYIRLDTAIYQSNVWLFGLVQRF
ncbi:MAG: tetratricopeptide repeat protein [Acidobacteriota bacterium]